MICNSLNPNSNKAKWAKSVNNLYDQWNSNKHLVDAFGKVGLDTDAQRIFEETFFTVTGMVPSDAPQGKWYDSQIQLVSKEIEKMAKHIVNPRDNWFVSLVGTTSANLEATPQSKLFLEEIRQTSNFEASQTNRMNGYVERIRKNLVAAIMEETGDKQGMRAAWKQSRALKKIEDVEAQLAAAIASSDPGAPERVKKYSAEIESLTEQHGGKINRMFVSMLDNYTVEQLTKIDENGQPFEISYVGKNGEVVKEVLENRSIVAAAIESKKLLKDMGINLARALSGFSDFTKMVHANGVYKNKSTKDIINDNGAPRELKRRLTLIDDAMNSLQESLKTGKYYPHYLINANAKIMSGIATVANKYRTLDDFQAADNAEGVREIFDNLRDFLPSVAKQRGSDSSGAYFQNALGVIKQYSADVINFNKLVYSQNALVKAFNTMPRGEGAGEGWQGIREYMLKTFVLHTDGYQSRDPNINNIVRTVTAFEFVSKMGFGLTTAARNAASISFFIHHVGWGNWKRMGKEIQENQNLRAAIDDVSKNHVGFLYGVDVSQISQGGVNATEGIKGARIRESGINEGEFEVRDVGLANKAVNTGIDSAVRMTGVFQSKTENWMRREMFERTFAQFYTSFSKHPHYMLAQRTVQGLEKGSIEYKEAIIKMREAESDLRKRAANYALRMVNDWAFEYSPSSKAVIAGGSTTNSGAIGQVLMQFMHYPLEFTYRQTKQGVGAMRAVGAAMDSSDAYRDRMRFLMSNPDVRGAVLTMLSTVLTGYLTALTGSNIAGLFENAAVEKAQAMFELLTGDEEEKKQANYNRGLVNLFTGPFLSDIMTIGMAQGVLDLPDDQYSQMLLGFNQFIDDTEEQKFHATLRTLQPHMYNLRYKDIPNMMSGNMGKVLERNLAMAPNKETTAMREKYMGDRGGAVAEYFKDQKMKKRSIEAAKKRAVNKPEMARPETFRPSKDKAIEALQQLRGN